MSLKIKKEISYKTDVNSPHRKVPVVAELHAFVK